MHIERKYIDRLKISKQKKYSEGPAVPVTSTQQDEYKLGIGEVYG